MSENQNTAETNLSDAPSAEAPRRKRNVMNTAERYEVMTIVRQWYQEKGMTDSEFARWVSSMMGFKIAPSTIKSYREVFGIEPIKSASVSDLRARIAELEAELAALAAKAAPTSEAE
jgi:hypothetical protein